jgi:hypothetical protein
MTPPLRLCNSAVKRRFDRLANRPEAKNRTAPNLPIEHYRGGSAARSRRNHVSAVRRIPSGSLVDGRQPQKAVNGAVSATKLRRSIT